MRFIVYGVTCFVFGVLLATCYRRSVQYVFFTLSPIQIYLFDRFGCCPSQCPIAWSFSLSAEDQYRGGYLVWSLHLFLIVNNKWVFWCPMCYGYRWRETRVDFFLFPGCAVRRGWLSGDKLELSSPQLPSVRSRCAYRLLRIGVRCRLDTHGGIRNVKKLSFERFGYCFCSGCSEGICIGPSTKHIRGYQ